MLISHVIFRLFVFKGVTHKLIPWRESLYSDHCLLKVFSVKLSGTCEIVCTTATDGKLACWDVDKLDYEYRPFCVLSLHQSGINACDWVVLSKNKILLVSGGDDSTVLCTVLNFSTDKLNVIKEAEQILKSGHVSNITGMLLFCYVYSTITIFINIRTKFCSLLLSKLVFSQQDSCWIIYLNIPLN